MTDEHVPADRTSPSLSRRRVLGVAGAGAVGALAGCLGGGGGGGAGSLPENGDPELLSDVESFPSEGVEHVERGTDIEYDTRPPTSGPHYSGVVNAGFYEEPQAMGDVVHTLEHGAVVAYYAPDALTEEAESSLTEWANTYTDTWQSFVAMPYPYDDPEASYALTAWRHRLRMDEYDEDVVRAFAAEYIGRGPENAVR
ncbi:DUF3105 domain-containing protein [Halobaculum sp. CBA1158]|uniref:DUF3105 domain-containing protein n=1 Tax=Halobaculum sp. CBA1158 TaxID=2904243 RepID=UPI001F484AB2|nr:DUF3105 domain-containing protein [Halobaculum sp. CBA1158]UIO99656.1 DUF3105 domain-containing protein [Halobaculum sp. CBA1158]